MRLKPPWLPSHLPALDGWRGVAILLVLFYHSLPHLLSLHLAGAAAWGWTGVNLFFVLSGFLITGIILDSRGRPGFFGNFYARRGLRILPVYALVVPVNYFVFGRANTWSRPGVFWPYFVLFGQNLVHGLTGTIEPTWSLAIEEQFYLIWAPLARRLPRAALGTLLGGVLALEPYLRRHGAGLPPTHTLFHLDGLAAGALVALGVRRMPWSPARWGRLGWGAVGAGLGVWYWAWRGHGSYLDTGFAILFAGVLLLAVAGDGLRAQNGVKPAGLMRRGALPYLGKISYGLYLTHMLVFALLGGIDARLAPWGAVGDGAILAMRLAASILVASCLWYGLEAPLLRLKRYFAPGAAAAAPELAPVAPAAS